MIMKSKIYIGSTIYLSREKSEPTTAAPRSTEPHEKSIGWCERPKAKPLSEELKAQFIDYFMTKYPITKRITLRRKGAYYRANVYYKEENNRVFEVWARTYEMLVVKMRMWYDLRGIPSVHGW